MSYQRCVPLLVGLRYRGADGSDPPVSLRCDVAKRSAGAARLRLEFCGHVFIKSQGSTHVLMLLTTLTTSTRSEPAPAGRFEANLTVRS
jgi:hypothetical protein